LKITLEKLWNSMLGIRVRATPSVFKTCQFGSGKWFWPRIFGQDGMDGT
jgi:hypothetical protein